MLKGLIDHIMGPYTDADFARKMIHEQKEAGPAINDRILKPRVVGFMAIAGSTTPDQVTLALPTLHSWSTACMRRLSIRRSSWAMELLAA
jgi:hypothetical protein